MNTLYHIRIVKAAFNEYLSPLAVDHVIRYNFNTDFYGAIGWKIKLYKVFPFYPIARRWYMNSDHFDQLATPETIVKNWHIHRDRIMELADDSKYPPKKIWPIFRILGRSSHAISDIPSHTNFFNVLYDYYRDEPDARKVVEASGKSIADYLTLNGPTFGQIVFSPQYSDFREKYFPKLFSFISIPDIGPLSHAECGIDAPSSPACKNDDYPGIFDIVLNLAKRDVTVIIRDFFEKLRNENPEKFKIITEAFRGAEPAPGEPGKYERRAFFWATKVGGWD